MLRGLLVLAAAFALGACVRPQPAGGSAVPPTPTAAAPTATPPRPASPVAPTAVAPSPTPVDPAPAPLTSAAELPHDDPQYFAGAVPAPRDQAALAAAFRRVPADLAAPTASAPAAVGDVAQFWVLDRVSGSYVQVNAELRYAGPIVLMYIDTELTVDQDAIERSARVFEQAIYPRTRALFGAEASPGVDGDPRLTVLNTNLRGAGGYFSSDDAALGGNRFSNRREMFVMGLNSFPIGTPGYDATLAHEFQHMIGWNTQRRSPAWLGEGMAGLAEDLNGYVNQGTASAYLAAPDLQLTDWESTGAHYGMSRLFLRYVHEQYAGDAGLRELTAAPPEALPQTFAAITARRRPDVGGFVGLFGDWAVANLLNDPAVGDGRYAYRLLPALVVPTPPEAGGASADVRQFGADYLGPLQGPLALAFDGADSVSLVGAPPASGHYAWWSNRGDESVMTLTRELDLSGVAQATLHFRVWHEIERHFDYAFITVSADGGATWETLPGRTTTADDPQGQNLGHALTGISGAPGAELGEGVRGTWVDERMDLTPYTGRAVLLRFWLVSDTAINGPGMLIDDVRVPEIGFADGAEEGEGGWRAEGFVRTRGALPQRWELRLVRYTPGGVAVERVAADAAGRAEARVPAG
ncbi:MAG TPA: hypothetical protein VNL77_13810, partial [Roseiflexaceae bacterium]|nr:hypothetical protein [Roseiflexaceae bacterium]